MAEKSVVITEVCAAISRGTLPEAAEVLRRDYPFAASAPAGRNYSEMQSTKLFMRDGFIDRYSGERLVFPGTLRLLSRLLPAVFPFQTNWRMSETHPAFWELFPTVDHVLPIARGGVDAEENWVTTSMLRNNAKSNWTLEELKWPLLPPGDIRVWDGLMNWFLEYSAATPSALDVPYLKRWHRAARSCPESANPAKTST